MQPSGVVVIHVQVGTMNDDNLSARGDKGRHVGHLTEPRTHWQRA